MGARGRRLAPHRPLPRRPAGHCQPAARAAGPGAGSSASAPSCASAARRFRPALPPAALVAVALLVLTRPEGFTRVGWSLGAGGVFAVGMLTKPPFAAYLLPPVVWLV